MAVLEAHELYRFFHAGDDETFALRGVSLDVEAGEILAIVGPSGSGKSTLLACLAGLDEPDGGHVVVAGERLTRRSERARAALRARWIGMLSQTSNLLEHLTLAQNVEVAHTLAEGTGRARRSDSIEAVGLSQRATAWPATLSGGESARAALAVALANDPPVLLADEPTGEIDAANENVVLGLLRERAEAGGAVVVVTHSDVVAEAASRVVHLRDGRVEDA
jgi:putative ABC transport system ATP-binding protein